MKRIKLAAVILIAVVIISAGIWWLARSASSETSTDILTSGFIEARDVAVAMEAGGRIVEITADEGDSVTAGTPLVRLDDTLLSEQRKQAAAAVSLAGACLHQATVSRDGALKMLEDARDVQDNPLQLDSQIAAARRQLELAELDLLREKQIETELNVPAAEVRLETAQKVLKNLEDYNTLGLLSFYEIHKLIYPAEGDVRLSELNLAYLQELQSQWRIPSAQARRDMAREALDSLLAISSNPQDIKAAVTRAEAAANTAVAAVAVAEKQVEQAEAALAVIDVQLSQLTVNAPMSGVVAERYAEVGEIAQPGAPLLKLIALDRVTLTTYVPESKIGLVKLGQKALVFLDSYPADSFSGSVVYISPQAQFTPRDVQLKEEREKTVFAVKISLDNPQQKMKPGMPADARIATGPGG